MDHLNNIICILLLMSIYGNRVLYQTHFTGKHVNISVPRRLTLLKLNLAIHGDPAEKQELLNTFQISGYTPTTLVEDIEKIKTCVKDVQVYRNKQNNDTLAYVSAFKLTRALFRINKAIFVNTKHWDELPIINQAATIIHECSHLSLATQDHAYSNSPLYHKLQGLKAKQNADTFTELILILAKSATHYVAVDSIESFF